MLILRRKKNESILIGDNIRITVIESAADGVRLAIDAPRQVSILREELSQAEQENKDSVAPHYDSVANLQANLLGRMKPKKLSSPAAKDKAPDTSASGAPAAPAAPKGADTSTSAASAPEVPAKAPAKKPSAKSGTAAAPEKPADR